MKIVVFIEGTTFCTKFPLFLISKHGYKPIGNAVEVVNTWQKEGSYV